MSRELEALKRIHRACSLYLDYANDGVQEEDFKIIEAALNKLDKLENIEEKLGFDLIKFLKATINGIYIKEFKKLYLDYNFEPTIYRFNNKGKYFERECEDMGARWIEKYYLKDYGKTWVLTKEELENASDND